MSAANKPRSDAVLLNLPAHQQDALAAWLMEEGVSYERAVERLWMDFSVKTSEASLSSFWQKVCAPRRLRRAAEAADALPGAAGGLTANWKESSVALLRQHFFEMLAAPAVDPGDLLKFGMMIADVDRRELKERELSSKEEGFRLKYEQKERELKLNQEKFLASLRSKLEQGLAALLEEIKGNPAAVVIFERLKAEMEAAAQPA